MQKNKIVKILRRFFLKINEKTFQGRLRYIYKKNGTDKLVIVFSAFNSEPSYNYMRTLSDLKCDKLFILDDFGFKGSYYWFENGETLPLDLTSALIKNILEGGNFKHLITVGSSKGGTCAIYYGLMFRASHIYSAACQYYVGNYLNTEKHMPILKGMLGENYSENDFNSLNNMMHNQLEKFKNAQTLVHLLYSENEHTYREHIVFLLQDLARYKIPFVKTIEEFKEHNEVGAYFIPFLKKELKLIERDNWA